MKRRPSSKACCKCIVIYHCVSNSGGKLTFGTGTKLIIETSKNLYSLIYFFDIFKCPLDFKLETNISIMS